MALSQILMQKHWKRNFPFLATALSVYIIHNKIYSKNMSSYRLRRQQSHQKILTMLLSVLRSPYMHDLHGSRLLAHHKANKYALLQ